MIRDRIYGSFEVNEDVLLELIQSYPVQRLKGINQHGIAENAVTDFPRISRYEHSIGVMLLLRKLGASQEEQVAGLLHDVSHTAFSHVADFLFGDPTKSDYQDSNLKDYINGSVMREILLRHGFDAERISELEVNGGYGLLERGLPDLCADRVDYALRDYSGLFKEDVGSIVDDITVNDNEMVFRSMDGAIGFGRLYMGCQTAWWMNNESKLRYVLMADLFSLAIKKGILTRDGMYNDDNNVLKILKDSGDKEVLDRLDLVLNRLEFVESNDEGAIELKGKIRHVDPKFMAGGKVTRLSAASNEYRDLLESEVKRHSKKVTVRLTSPSPSKSSGKL